MQSGQRKNTNEAIGEVIVLDVQEHYLILFRTDVSQFIKANNYKENEQGEISWDNGEYYNNFNDLLEAIKK